MTGHNNYYREGTIKVGKGAPLCLNGRIYPVTFWALIATAVPPGIISREPFSLPHEGAQSRAVESGGQGSLLSQNFHTQKVSIFLSKKCHF